MSSKQSGQQEQRDTSSSICTEQAVSVCIEDPETMIDICLYVWQEHSLSPFL